MFSNVGTFIFSKIKSQLLIFLSEKRVNPNMKVPSCFFVKNFGKKPSACGRWERFIVFVVIFDVVFISNRHDGEVLVSLIVVQSSWHGERGVLVSSIVVPSRGHRGWVLVFSIVVPSRWHRGGVLVSSIVVPSRGHRGGVLVSLVVVHVDPRQPHGEVVVVFHHVQDVLLPKVVVKLRQPVEAVLIIGVLVSN